MQLTGTEEVAASAAQVFAELTAFDALEHRARQRGLQVQRRFDTDRPTLGDSWDLGLMFRNKMRRATVTLDRWEAPNTLRVVGVSDGLDLHMQIDVRALSPYRSRVTVVGGMQPNTVSARLFVQSLKLAQSMITARFQARIARFAREIETKVHVTGEGHI